MDSLRYWADVAIALCGFDASEDVSVAGIVVVLAALAVLVYATHRAVVCTFWPGEIESEHIKFRILVDEEHHDAR